MTIFYVSQLPCHSTDYQGLIIFTTRNRMISAFKSNHIISPLPKSPEPTEKTHPWGFGPIESLLIPKFASVIFQPEKQLHEHYTIPSSYHTTPLPPDTCDSIITPCHHHIKLHPNHTKPSSEQTVHITVSSPHISITVYHLYHLSSSSVMITFAAKSD